YLKNGNRYINDSHLLGIHEDVNKIGLVLVLNRTDVLLKSTLILMIIMVNDAKASVMLIRWPKDLGWMLRSITLIIFKILVLAVRDLVPDMNKIRIERYTKHFQQHAHDMNKKLNDFQVDMTSKLDSI